MKPWNTQALALALATLAGFAIAEVLRVCTEVNVLLEAIDERPRG